jgi:hypothetical protein
MTSVPIVSLYPRGFLLTYHLHLGKGIVNNRSLKETALTLPDSGCINRPVYGGPCRDIQTGVPVSVELAATRKTMENTLALSVLFSTVSTDVTRPARVTRVNEVESNARHPRLIRHERAELKECPVSELPSHLTIKAVASFPNAREGFKRECLPRGKCVLNELPADIMVDPPLVVRCAATDAAEVLPGVLRPLALQKGADALRLAATGFDGLTRIRATIAICRKADDAEVNAKNAVRFHERRVGKVARRQKIEVPADKGEVTLTLLKGEHGPLMLTADERQAQTAIHRPNGDFGLVRVPSQNAVVIGNRPVRLERALNLLVKFVGVGDFRVAPNHDLSGQVKGGAGRCVGSFVKCVLAERLILPCPRTDAVAGGVGAGERLLQGFRLRFGNDQFNLYGEFQDIIIVPDLLSQNLYLTRKGRIGKPLAERVSFLYRLKATVS